MPGRSLATVSFQAGAFVDVTIDSITNLTTAGGSVSGVQVFGIAENLETNESLIGGGSLNLVEIVEPPMATQIGLGESVTIDLFLRADLTSGPSAASAKSRNRSSVRFENTTVDQTYEIGVDLSVISDVLTDSISSAAGAVSRAMVSLAFQSDGFQIVGGSSAESTGIGFDNDFSREASVFTFILAPGDVETILSFAEVSGIAAISLPASLWLFLPGVPLMLSFRNGETALSKNNQTRRRNSA